jgi:hypothetical protein
MMRTSIVFTIAIVLAVATDNPATGAKKKTFDWQTGKLVSAEWVVTRSAGTVMVPQRESVPCPAPTVVVPPARGQVDTSIYNTCTPTSKTVSVPVTAPEEGYFAYRIETPTMIYMMSSTRRLNVTINGRVWYAWDKKDTYILQDDNTYVKVGLYRKEAK